MRHRLRAAMGQQELDIRRVADRLGLYQCGAVLLAEPGCAAADRQVPAE